jgi:hypothetical protein
VTAGPLAAALLAAAAAAPAPAAPAEDPVRALSDRADSLVERLYAAPGDAALLAEAAALREEALAAGATGVAERVQGQLVYVRPQSRKDRLLYARILRSRGRVREAVKDLRAHLVETPSDCDGYGLLAEILRSEGDHAGAAEVHEAHLREHRDEARPFSALGRLVLWSLRDEARTRAVAGRMRAAADGPEASPRTAPFLRGEAAFLEAEADRLVADRAAVLAAEGRADLLLAGALAGFAALLAAAFVATRPRPGGPPAGS